MVKLKIKSKIKRALAITGIVIVSFVVIVIIFISPIAKYLIEKYDVKIIGREVKVGVVYLNPFTAYIHIGNLRMYEQKSDSIFITASSLNVNFDWYKFIFKKTYEISSITLNKPVINVKQQRTLFNFNDIIDKFTPKEKTIVKKARTKFNILNIEINDGRLNYRELVIPVNYYVKHIDMSSPGMWWNRDTMPVKLAFENGPSTGKIKGDITINLNTNDYRINLTIKKFDLKFLEQYIHDMSNYGNFSANLDAEAHAKGNFKSILETDAKGWVSINDFHFGKRPNDDFASFDKLMLSFSKVNPKNFVYYLDSATLTHPFFVYEQYDYLNNLERMFGKGGSKIKEAHADSSKFNPIFEIAKGIQQIAMNFAESYYKVDKVAIYGGNIGFNDFSPRERFSVAANPLYILADSIDKHLERFDVTIKMPIKPYGNLDAHISVDPNDYQYFDANYNLQKVSIPLFNPYLISYTSFPLDRGSLEFNGHISVVGGNINSQNHLVILDPRVGKRLRKKDTKWIPMPLIMSLVRERGNVIDYQIPITGDLKNPKIHFKDIILDLIKNIFVKPPTAPYAFKVRNVENEVEKSLTLKWQIKQSVLNNKQEKFLNKIASFLKSNPETSITVKPVQYTDKEKEYILFYEAKKKYFLETHHVNSLSGDDSMFIEKMSVKDSGFIHFLKQRYNDNDIDFFTIQQKCMAFVGKNVVNAKYEALLKAREQVFLQPFKDNGTEKQMKLTAAVNTVPFNGFSYFELDYKGEVPPALSKAYDELDQLNEEEPREKYLDERKKTKSTSPVPVPGTDNKSPAKNNNTISAK